MDNARLYAHSNALQKRDAIAVLREFLPQMAWDAQDGETLLDVGCGSGDVTKSVLFPLLPENIRRIVGVDLSQEMVSFASKHFDHNLIEYRQLDISNVNNPRQIFPEGFSKITSFYCLHWIQDQVNCIRNMFHLLMEEGQALLVFLASNPIFTMYENMSQKPRWKNYMTDVSKFIPRYQYKENPDVEFQTIAEETGFEVEYCKAPKMNFPFENTNYLKKAISAVNPFASRIPAFEREEFLSECLQELLGICPENANGGGTVANYRLMVALLRKPSSERIDY